MKVYYIYGFEYMNYSTKSFPNFVVVVGRRLVNINIMIWLKP